MQGQRASTPGAKFSQYYVLQLVGKYPALKRGMSVRWWRLRHLTCDHPHETLALLCFGSCVFVGRYILELKLLLLR